MRKIILLLSTIIISGCSLSEQECEELLNDVLLQNDLRQERFYQTVDNCEGSVEWELFVKKPHLEDMKRLQRQCPDVFGD